MYAKCGALAKVRKVFEELPNCNVISWSALIAGYIQQGEDEQAPECFKQMQQAGHSPDPADMGERVHDAIAKQGLLRTDIVLGTTLVDMYAKCGALAKVQKVFEELPICNVVSWSALIAGYTQQGEGEQAPDCFKQMQQEGYSPDPAAFLSVLNACSRLGLVEDAQMYLGSMSSRDGMKPDSQHYSCLVDLFGRAGHLDKAVQVIEKMPSFESGAWSSILAACQKWGDVNIGKWAFKHAVQFDNTDAAYYVLMANIFAAAGLHKDGESLEGSQNNEISYWCKCHL